MEAARELKALMLQEPRWTLAAAESLTCGHLQASIGSVSGASNYFLGGLTAYTLDQKVRHLGVERAAAKKVNSVSSQVALQMALGVCELFESDIGVATTGYAEPYPEAGAAVPFACWAIVARRVRRGKKATGSELCGRIELPGASRVEVQQMVAAAVLAELVAWVKARRAEG